MTSPRLIVIGTSAGGLDALTDLVGQLPADFPGIIFIVQHLAPDSNGAALLRALRSTSPLDCRQARDGESFVAGRVYLAPPDHHMMLKAGKILTTKGARENGWRPAIDPLFRSAAVAYGNRVIGVILTGYLDDGSAGLSAIQRCGGVCVVQAPADAAYPDMPMNALHQVEPDYCVPIAEMGAVLSRLVERKLASKVKPPQDIMIEARIAERVLSDLPSVRAVGKQVPFNCPGCGGVLWELAKGDGLRFRCHVGHAYTAPVLLALQTEKIEETLWIALRMFEERRNMLERMAAFRPNRKGSNAKPDIPGAGDREIYASTRERAKEATMHIERIRELLRMGEAGTTRVEHGTPNRRPR